MTDPEKVINCKYFTYVLPADDGRPFYLISRGYSVCDECQEGYYLNDLNHCLGAIDNCLTHDITITFGE